MLTRRDFAVGGDVEQGNLAKVVGVGDEHDGALFGCHICDGVSVPVGFRWGDLFTGAAAGARSGRVFEEDRSTSRVEFPRPGVVCLGAVHEEHDIASFHDGLHRDAQVSVSRTNTIWHPIVGLVAGRDAGESAHVCLAIVELPGHGDATDVRHPILVTVGDVWTMGFAVPVHRVPGRAFDADDEHRAVVQTEALLAHDA